MNKRITMNKIRLIISLVLLFSITIGFSENHSQPGKKEILKFIRTVQVTDANSGAALGYIHYVPATDHFVVMLRLYTNKSRERSLGFKEYTTDMQPTGKFDFITSAAADATSQIIGNDIYVASMTAEPPVIPGGKPQKIGWLLEKFNAVSWKRLAYVKILLDLPFEEDNGPTISFINGKIDVTGEYYPDGNPDSPLGRGSHHHFFTTDLKPLGKMILRPPQYPAHCPEVSMIQEPGGDILMFAASAFNGDLIVLKFDKTWKYKEQKKLRDMAFFPTGSLTDGNLFYVAYTDTSNRKPMQMYRNVRLAVYDADWNTLQDIAVTDFINTPDTHVDGESPWIELHGNRLYVSYLASKLDPITGELIGGQAFVNIYEIIRNP